MVKKLLIMIGLLCSVAWAGNQHRAVSGFRSFEQCTVTVAGKYHRDIFTLDAALMGDSLQRVVYADSLGNGTLNWWGQSRTTASCTTWIYNTDTLAVGKTFRRYYYKPGQRYTGNIYTTFGVEGEAFGNDYKRDKWIDVVNWAVNHDIAVDTNSEKYVSEPWIFQLENDSVYAIYYKSDTLLHTGTDDKVEIAYKVSGDEGVTWSERRTLYDSTGYTDIPASVKVHNFRGKQTVFMLRRLFKTGEPDREIFTYSQDTLKTWSEGVILNPDTTDYAHGDMVFLPSGRCVVATYLYAVPYNVVINYADTPYTSWNSFSFNLAGQNLNETSLYIAKGGVVRAVSRSETSPFNYYQTDLDVDAETAGESSHFAIATHSAAAPISFLYTSRGDLMGFFGNGAATKLVVSSDSGDTWRTGTDWYGVKSFGVTNGNSGRASYATACELSNGKIAVIWATNRIVAPVTSNIYINFVDAYRAAPAIMRIVTDRRPLEYVNGILRMRTSYDGEYHSYVGPTRINGFAKPSIFVWNAWIDSLHQMGLQDTSTEADANPSQMSINFVNSLNYYYYLEGSADTYRTTNAASANQTAWHTWSLDWRSDSTVWKRNNTFVYGKAAADGSGIANALALNRYHTYANGAKLDINYFYARPYTVTDPNLTRAGKDTVLYLSTKSAATATVGESVDITGWGLIGNASTLYFGTETATKTASTDSTATLTVPDAPGDVVLYGVRGEQTDSLGTFTILSNATPVSWREKAKKFGYSWLSFSRRHTNKK